MRAIRSSLARTVVGYGEGAQGSSLSRGWCKERAGVQKETVVEEKNNVYRVPGSSPGGTGQEELLRGKKDVQIERKRDAGFLQSWPGDRG